MKFPWVKVALLSFFAIQGYSNGKSAEYLPGGFTLETALVVGLCVFLFALLATLLQKFERDYVRELPFLGFCFLVGVLAMIASANAYGTVDRVLGFSACALLFASGFTVGAVAKLKLDFRVS